MDRMKNGSVIYQNGGAASRHAIFSNSSTRICQLVPVAFLLLPIFIICFMLTSPVSALDWTIETVDSNDDVGYYSSLSLDNAGYPRISYWDWTNNHLKYAAKTGVVWVNETVDKTKNSGEFSSLKLDRSGQPYISYYDSNRGNLSFVTVIEDNWTRITVESGGVGRYSSLVLDNAGNPGIAYQDLLNMKLKYAEKNGGLWMNETVDNSGNVGAYSSLARDGSGNPSISYYDAGHGFLRYASRSGGLWTCTTVDGTGNPGYYTSLALDAAGNPRISYYDGVGRDLKFVSKTGGVWKKETVDSAGSVGKWTSLALDTYGNPHISYFDETNGHLKYAVKSGLVWTNETVDTGANVGTYTSLALDSSGNPCISYRDGGYGDLRYAAGIPPLVPDFTASSREGPAPLTVQFTDMSRGGSPSCWNWSFGDGTWFNTSLAEERNPSHVYVNPGVYDVTMIIRNFTVIVRLSRPEYVMTQPPATTIPTPTQTSPPLTIDPTPSPSPTPEPTSSVTPTPSPSPTPEPTSSVTPTPSPSPTPDPTSSVTPTPSPSPTPEPTSSVTPTPSPSPTPDPTSSVIPTPSPLPTPEPTSSVTPLLPVEISDRGSDDPPDMPPVQRNEESLVSQTVNVGGDTAIRRVTVTGRGLSDIIIIAQRIPVLPANVPPLDGPVYQYIDLLPVHYTLISTAFIEFDIPPTFLVHNHAAPDQVRMCMRQNQTWICLPTRFEADTGSKVSYSTESPEFSLFAITLSNETSGTTKDTSIFPMVKDPRSQYAPMNPDAPVVSRANRTAVNDEPVAGSLMLAIITGAGLCGLAAGVIIIHRWLNQ
jgi:PGF-pre-PGF domain-containing protein